VKKLLVLVLVLVLAGCASQKSWHVKYLEKDLEIQKDLSVAYADSLATISNLAVSVINQRDANIQLYQVLIEDFILLSDSVLVDSLLKKHGVSYTKPENK